MKILADSQIPLVESLFAFVGDVETYTGRSVSREQLDNVDVLLVRSTLKVNAELLDGTSVRFVGTCTIGTDHLDTQYLDQQGITWANAAGCNADSVVQYVLSAMANSYPHWMNASVGIIACGNIGRRVYQRLSALGLSCRCYDPFLDAADSNSNSSEHIELTSLEEVLQADIITSHAPLTTTGPFPTESLLGANEFQQIRPDSLLISAGRGAVLDNDALLTYFQTQEHKGQGSFSTVLDVWANEPDILTDLMPYVDIATPHIAGYSLDGRENGSVMIRQALQRFLERSITHIESVPTEPNYATLISYEQSPLIVDEWVVDECFNDSSTDNPISHQAAFNQLLLAAYPILGDDQRLRDWQRSDMPLPQYFDYLRRNYPVRREYTHFIFPEWAQQSPYREWFSLLMK